MTRSLKITLLALIACCATGCLEKYPSDAILHREAISTIQEANQAVIGIYAQYKNPALYSGHLTLLPDIQSDLVYAVEGFTNTYGDVWRWDILATNPQIESVYAELYTVIGRCNFFFESIVELEESLTDDRAIDQLQDLKGEAYFARALAYSELIKCFCKAYDPATADNELGVALISSYYHPERMIRSSLKASYEFVISDLEKARDLVTLDEKNNSPYITVSAVKALLARVCLYIQDWENARDYASEVIDDKALQLSSATRMIDSKQSYYQYMWNYDSATEIIWKIGFTPTSYGGALGRVFLNYDHVSYKPDYVPGSDALALYSANDLRFKAFFAQTTTGYAHGLTWPLLMKYYGNREFTAQNILHVNMPKVFRLSEQYLIRAEAYCRLKQFGKASDDLTKLRTARYTTYGSAIVGEDNWLKEISEERVRELFMEGFRLQDLKRWHMGFERKHQLNTVKTGSTKKIEAGNPLFVWPIPQHELDAPGSELQPNDSNQ